MFFWNIEHLIFKYNHLVVGPDYSGIFPNTFALTPWAVRKKEEEELRTHSHHEKKACFCPISHYEGAQNSVNTRRA